MIPVRQGLPHGLFARRFLGPALTSHAIQASFASRRLITGQASALQATGQASTLPETPQPPLNTSNLSPNSSKEPKPFPSPPPYKSRTPEWLRKSPTFVKAIKAIAVALGHKSNAVTAIRETRWMYNACAEREVTETGFIYVECQLPATFQTWFQFTNLHIWLLNTRFRGLPSPHGRLYMQELATHFFLDIEYRLRSVYGPKVPERIIKNHMTDLRDQWNGTTASYDIALMRGDTELAAAIWRNMFAGRGEKAYKEKDLSLEEREQRIAKRTKNNDPEAVGAPLEDIPRLVYLFTAHVRRELKRLEEISDADILAGKLGTFGTVGGMQRDTAALEVGARKLEEDAKPRSTD